MAKAVTNQLDTTGWLRRVARRVIAPFLESLSCAPVRRGIFAMCLVAFGAYTPAFLPGGNSLMRVPFASLLQTHIGQIVGTVVLLSGLVMLMDAWLRLYPKNNDQRWNPAAVVSLWSIPLLPVPPLFSNDAYSYAAQGRAVHLNMDPYRFGPASAPGAFAPQVDDYWKETPAPYGPLALQIQHGIVNFCDHNAFLSAVMMRLPAFIALLVIAWIVPWIARKIGRSDARAAWFSVINPLCIMHLVGGSHNDAIMIALVAIALALAVHHWYLMSFVMIAAACAVKQPAIFAIAPVAALWAHHRGLWHTRSDDGNGPFFSYKEEASRQVPVLALGVLGGLVVVLVFTAITYACRLDFGWIGALSVPGEVRTPLSPQTMIGMAGEGIFHFIGWRSGALMAVPTMRAIGAAIGLALLVWMWLRYGRKEPWKFAAWGFIIIAVASPSLHIWYLLWGGVLLPLASVSESTMRKVVWAVAFGVSYSSIDAAVSNGAIAAGITALIAAFWLTTGHTSDLLKYPEAKSDKKLEKKEVAA